MIRKILWSVVIIIAVLSLYSVSGNNVLDEVKKRYTKLRKSPPEGMEKLKEEIVITGFTERYGEIGYNVHKGLEIGLCIDGTVNDVFHVLIHELAHTVTDNYSHDKQFWDNFNKIKDHCVSLGIYTPITDRKEFCGKFIRD